MNGQIVTDEQKAKAREHVRMALWMRRWDPLLGDTVLDLYENFLASQPAWCPRCHVAILVGSEIVRGVCFHCAEAVDDGNALEEVQVQP